MILDLAILRDLLARTQAATASDHRLNLELAAALLGGEIKPRFDIASGSVEDVVVYPAPLGSRETQWRQEARDWTGSLDAALTLICRSLPGWGYKATNEGSSCIFVLSEPPADSWSPLRQHAGGGPTTMPLAACAALLTALISKTERGQRAAALSEMAASDAELLP